MDPRDSLLREAEQLMIRAIAFESVSPSSLKDMDGWLDRLRSELGEFADCDVEGEGWVKTVETSHGPAEVCTFHRGVEGWAA
jgi:hypothetical protein